MANEQTREHYRSIVEDYDEQQQFDLLPTRIQDQLKDEWPTTLDSGVVFELAHACKDFDAGDVGLRMDKSWLSFLEGKKLFESYANEMTDQLMSNHGVDEDDE